MGCVGVVACPKCGGLIKTSHKQKHATPEISPHATFLHRAFEFLSGRWCLSEHSREFLSRLVCFQMR